MAAITGDEAGLVKVWDVHSRKEAAQVARFGEQTRKKGVLAMCWASEDTQQAYVAHADGSLCRLSRNDAEPGEEGQDQGGHPRSRWGLTTVLQSGFNLPISTGLMVDSSVNTQQIISLGAEGFLECYSLEQDDSALGEPRKLRVPRPITASALCQNFLAFGGKENDLKIYDLRAEKVIWKAWNVPRDQLGLRVPIFINAVDYIEADDPNLLVTATAHRHIRVYDRRDSARPVLSFGSIFQHMDTMPTCVRSVTRHLPNSAVVGDATGQSFVIDLRQERMINKLMPSATGSIRSISVHPTQPVVAITGLGRFASFFDLKGEARLCRAYLKQKSTAILLARDSCFEDKDLTEKDEVWIDAFKVIPSLQPLASNEIVKVYAGKPTPEPMDPKEKKRLNKKLKKQKEREAAAGDDAEEDEDAAEEEEGATPKPKKISRSERAFKRKLSGAAAGKKAKRRQLHEDS